MLPHVCAAPGEDCRDARDAAQTRSAHAFSGRDDGKAYGALLL